MLLYLIHCLMQLDKVAILYFLPKMPVITILIDRSDRCNPISVRSLPSSLPETWYTDGWPVIRIVDSIDPSAAQDMAGSFSVCTASLATCNTLIGSPSPNTPSWKGDYPLWTRQEFHAMLRCLGMTGREHWIRSVTASTIVDLHPLVIRLLGAYGCLVHVSDMHRLPTAPSSRVRTLYDGFQLEPDLNETELLHKPVLINRLSE
ncbi:hypothetical protein BLNAU_22746 [Blattamonas nauphoetae]|uniref:Uncharacterized protein n=1 Tax=Blattamonas nauphoetae TaxID=2049346 RepID=A0ABQ9WS76_9EUKA|nr:hypothetical protein BLNAU_22746 [Blattamonas nauphoetae]